jgi:hypothetical protein
MTSGYWVPVKTAGTCQNHEPIAFERVDYTKRVGAYQGTNTAKLLFGVVLLSEVLHFLGA